MPDTITVKAPAKVNLSLRITGRRDDGFHELESIVGFADVCDRITVSRSESVTLAVTGPEKDLTGPDDDNLAYRAAVWLKTQHRLADGASILLDKHLPVAAGLGGGSADAAATLTACRDLWSISHDGLAPSSIIAAELGADVPVCQFGRAAWLSGIGETLSPLSPWPETWLVLVNPRLPLSTAEVFRQFSGPLADQANPAPAQVDWGRSAEDFADALRPWENSLTETAISLVPQINDVLSALSAQSTCLLARMSGSGPTCFGLFAKAEEARQTANELAVNQPDWWIRSSPLLSQTR